MARIFGWILILIATLAVAADWCHLRMPSLGWLFEHSRDLSWASIPASWHPSGSVPWLAWLLCFVLWAGGFWFVFHFSGKTRLRPLFLKRVQRFREIRRGYWSLVILLVLALLAALDFVIVGSEALAVRYEGKWSYPAFTNLVEKGTSFGLDGEGASGPPDYRGLKKSWKAQESDNLVILPLWPYASTGDSITALATPLRMKDGRLYQGNSLFDGYAAQVYDLEQPENRHVSYRYRDGLKDGRAEGWDQVGEQVFGATYRKGELIAGSEKWLGDGEPESFLAQKTSELVRVHFQPAPPSREHWLGTTAQGYDVLSYLYGGLQANFQAAIVYIPLVYLIGITAGLLMGYLGGTFDLIVQRFIEVMSNVPFLFVVMIISLAVPPRMKEDYGLWIIVMILVSFGWMGMTYLMRTAALKEKSRDYVAAARVMGASTPRILRKHLLPNSVSIVVTLIPFSVSGLVMSLASLDYLGFGVPARYATWGKLLREGLDNLSAAWLASSAFFVLVMLLILVTFVGEAVREAFDPKKFSYYK